MPYCSLNYATTVAVPGDTFLIKNGRYGSGPRVFTKSGSASAPITYKAIGTNVVIGSFEDVRDEDFLPSEYPHVYSINKANMSPKGYVVYQTFFDPIVVDDPNATKFTMRQEDGPLVLTYVQDYTTLTNIEGTWLADATTGKIHVHAYGNRRPSTSSTDFVFGRGPDSLTLDTNIQYNIFDGFRLTYSSGVSFLILGSNNKFLNLRFQAVPFQLRGSNNYAENITISHVIFRGPKWEWYTDGDGTAMGVMGTGHKLRNLHFFHNWNSSIGSQRAPGVVIDGLRAHGAPNHCGSGVNNIVRNLVHTTVRIIFTYLNSITW